MQVSVEAVGALGRKLKVAVRRRTWRKSSTATQEVVAAGKMPGFRPGKVRSRWWRPSTAAV